jgi:hypothetical protein
MFLASFHNNDVTLSQFQVLVMLLQVSVCKRVRSQLGSSSLSS